MPEKGHTTQVLHATMVAAQGRGALILGPSGAGKSGLALQLIALGAQLVADDQTILRRDGGGIVGSAPQSLHGLIEARGIGILHSPALAMAPVHLVVDLGQTETERLPPRRTIPLLGVTCDLVLGSRSSHFPSGLLCYLLHGRHA